MAPGTAARITLLSEPFDGTGHVLGRAVCHAGMPRQARCHVLCPCREQYRIVVVVIVLMMVAEVGIRNDLLGTIPTQAGSPGHGNAQQPGVVAGSNSLGVSNWGDTLAFGQI